MMFQRLLRLATSLTLLTALSGLTADRAAAFTYPAARKEAVTDTYFGVKVADPYRWLEDDDSPETQAWVEAQNRLTRSFVDSPAREKIRARLTELWNYPKQGSPSHKGEWYYSWKNNGLQNQYVLTRQHKLDGPAETVLDPNTLSSDGTISVNTTALSEDGTRLAFGLSEAGSDTQTLHFKDLETGRELPDQLKGLSNSSVDWAPDRSGVFYNRYPDPGSIPNAQPHTHNRVYYHRLGTEQAKDEMVYADAAHPELDFYPFVSEDGQYLLIQSVNGTAPENGILYRPLNSGSFRELLPTGQASFSFVDNDGPVFYFLTDADAPRNRLIAIDTRQPDKAHWREIIPQGADVLDGVLSAGDSFVATWLHDAQHRLTVHTADGKQLREIQLPAPGTAGLRGRRQDPELFVSFASFVYPGEIYRYDINSGQMSLLRRSEVRFNPDQFETKQVFYPSKDGTRVPMFLIYKKGLKPDGSHPVLLYGYGGFNISLLPHFALTEIPWLEAGGVYAIANLRGGAEYGEAWHQAGILTHKQNVFDDFIAAGEWLIKQGWSHPHRLAIQGGSNGGLLTAACMIQRPDLYGAVVSQVPVIDMLRYHRFSVGRYWIPEYGSAEASEEQFRTLYAYSPLHNIKPVSYPPLLVMSADHDDRVVPAHAKKFIATLQATGTGNNPLLLRVETRAGHGAGKPTAKIIDELADMYGFLFKVLEVRN
ncbi:MAG: prolyl oligopeptidase family protein [Candidatus Sericytochromatia bacterium]